MSQNSNNQFICIFDDDDDDCTNTQENEILFFFFHIHFFAFFFWLRQEETSGEMLCGGLVVCGAFDEVGWWLLRERIFAKMTEIELNLYRMQV